MIRGKNSFYELAKQAIPDLPPPWGTEHHLARIFVRGSKMGNVATLYAQLDLVHEIVSFFSSPKRYWYFVGQATFFQVQFKALQNVAEQRWVLSHRNLMEDIIFDLDALQLATAQMIKSTFWKGKPKPEFLRKKLERFRSALQSHLFLESIHIWLDLLQVEAWATKITQSGCGDMLSKYKSLRKLPAKLNALVT